MPARCPCARGRYARSSRARGFHRLWAYAHRATDAVSLFRLARAPMCPEAYPKRSRWQPPTPDAYIKPPHLPAAMR